MMALEIIIVSISRDRRHMVLTGVFPLVSFLHILPTTQHIQKERVEGGDCCLVCKVFDMETCSIPRAF